MASPSKPFMLINTFSAVWEKYYHQKYMPSPKDFRHAKLFLQCSDGDFSADEIVERAEVYMNSNGFYSENRHGFTAFVNNINSFIKPKEEKPKSFDLNEYYSRQTNAR